MGHVHFVWFVTVCILCHNLIMYANKLTYLFIHAQCYGHCMHSRFFQKMILLLLLLLLLFLSFLLFCLRIKLWARLLVFVWCNQSLSICFIMIAINFDEKTNWKCTFQLNVGLWIRPENMNPFHIYFSFACFRLLFRCCCCFFFAFWTTSKVKVLFFSLLLMPFVYIYVMCYWIRSGST